jgi:thiamine phosphate synthase YjbQ (UPF0047 family)
MEIRDKVRRFPVKKYASFGTVISGMDHSAASVSIRESDTGLKRSIRLRKRKMNMSLREGWAYTSCQQRSYKKQKKPTGVFSSM